MASTHSFVSRNIDTDGIFAQLTVVRASIIFLIVPIITFLSIIWLILGISAMSQLFADTLSIKKNKALISFLNLAILPTAIIIDCIPIVTMLTGKCINHTVSTPPHTAKSITTPPFFNSTIRTASIPSKIVSIIAFLNFVQNSVSTFVVFNTIGS